MKLSTPVILDEEQLEVLRAALGQWIEGNEKTILDGMKDEPRAERLSQLNYHVMLEKLWDYIYEHETQLARQKREFVDKLEVPPLPPIDE